jgi:hypothetical protein
VKLASLPYSSERIVELRPVGNVQIEDGRQVHLTVSPVGVTVAVDGYTGICALPDPQDLDWLIGTVDSGAYVAELLSSGARVTLRVLTFDGLERWSIPREIAVDDRAVEQVRRLRQRGLDTIEVVTWLTEQVVVADAESLAVIATGAGANVNQDAFRLIGRSLAVDVRLHDDRLVVDRVSRRSNSLTTRVRLVRGELSFADATRVGQLSDVARAELRQLAEADNAYLAIWNEYNELERKAKIAAAREIGWAAYDDRRKLPDGRWEFDLVRSYRADALLDRLARETLGLEAGAVVPFDEPTASVGGGKEPGGVAGDATVSRPGAIAIAPGNDLGHAQQVPRRGYLYGAFTADRVRLDRRDSAQRRALVARAFPVHQLSRILAGQTPASPGRNIRRDALSHQAEKALGGRPTAAQLAAIDLALNTPDIALIQGPPGTGKTRVIAAIQARLAEVDAHAPPGIRRALLTSYQHDAVANLVLAVDDGRLPAVRVGGRPGQSEEVIAWAADLAFRLEERYRNTPAAPIVRASMELQDRQLAYLLLPPDIAGTIDLLRWLADQVHLVGADVAIEARRLSQRLRHDLSRRHTAAAEAEILRLARALRTTTESFEDDGRATAARAYRSQLFIDVLDDGQRGVLEHAASTASRPEEVVAELAELMRDVIDRLMDSRARSSIVAAMPEVKALLQRAQKAAERELQSSVSETDRIVEEFRRGILEQPTAVTAAIAAHTQALAATCQQAVSRGITEIQPTLAFDTVIVDEAARANPLDLMIPMTLAEGRIILVGDHRQLPQLLDDELAGSLSGRHDKDVVQKVLGRSLFERLFTRLRELEQGDGIRRVITLDRQFRMHPVLGEFVNAQFYAPYGEPVSNGVTDLSAFSHGLSRYGDAVCAWVDVPHRLGGEVNGASTSRPAEAEVVVRELDRTLGDDAELTCGVITFYKGQERAIWERMAERGLAVRVDRGFALNPSVQRLWIQHGSRQGLPRVRIGTVDAFQGREFDVVFLSTTRSNLARGHRDPRFGFLVLPNRLCVAMSRQRRLLVAVGDAAMFTTEAAQRVVPALAAFHELTGGRNGHRRSA